MYVRKLKSWYKLVSFPEDRYPKKQSKVGLTFLLSSYTLFNGSYTAKKVLYMSKYILFEISNSSLSYCYVCFLIEIWYIRGVGME